MARQTIRLTVTLTLDEATPERTRRFVAEYIDNLKGDTRDCWMPRGASLMGYEGPFVRSVKVTKEA